MLSVIDELPPDDEEKIAAVVRSTFGGDHDWRATVRKTMGWPPSVDDEIRMNWSRFQQMARDESIVVDRVVFAQSFGDELPKY